MIDRKRKIIHICAVDSINIINRIIVKHFLLFNTNLTMYKDRYHIGYTVEDLSPKIFFSSFSQIITNKKFYNKVGNVCFNICSPDFADRL